MVKIMKNSYYFVLNFAIIFLNILPDFVFCNNDINQKDTLNKKVNFDYSVSNFQTNHEDNGVNNLIADNYNFENNNSFVNYGNLPSLIDSIYIQFNDSAEKYVNWYYKEDISLGRRAIISSLLLPKPEYLHALSMNMKYLYKLEKNIFKDSIEVVKKMNLVIVDENIIFYDIIHKTWWNMLKKNEGIEIYHNDDSLNIERMKKHYEIIRNFYIYWYSIYKLKGLDYMIENKIRCLPDNYQWRESNQNN